MQKNTAAKQTQVATPAKRSIFSLKSQELKAVVGGGGVVVEGPHRP